MTSIKEIESLQYASSTLKRAERALCCSPFGLNLFIAMQNSSVPLGAIASSSSIRAGLYKKIALQKLASKAISCGADRCWVAAARSRP
ncbi:MAG: hypothetical protein HC820_03470, partial [Hydrococcus sp. RM1_1_31]|nr:hypothetical protein [Hydrococcus sp. RM1_1_31]